MSAYCLDCGEPFTGVHQCSDWRARAEKAEAALAEAQELAAFRKSLVDNWQAKAEELVAWGEAAKKRSAAIEGYAEHHRACEAHPSKPLSGIGKCTCGLAALLGAGS